MLTLMEPDEAYEKMLEEIRCLVEYHRIPHEYRDDAEAVAHIAYNTAIKIVALCIPPSNTRQDVLNYITFRNMISKPITDKTFEVEHVLAFCADGSNSKSLTLEVSWNDKVGVFHQFVLRVNGSIKGIFCDWETAKESYNSIRE